MENLQNQLRDVLMNFYIFFLRKEGFKVHEGGSHKMNGGKNPVQEMMIALFSALLMTLVIIKIISSEKKPEKIEGILKNAIKNPEETVDYIKKNQIHLLKKVIEEIEATKSDKIEITNGAVLKVLEKATVLENETGVLEKETGVLEKETGVLEKETGVLEKATEISVTDPTVTDPTVTDPTVTDPTVTDPTVTDPTVNLTNEDINEMISAVSSGIPISNTSISNTSISNVPKQPGSVQKIIDIFEGNGTVIAVKVLETTTRGKKRDAYLKALEDSKKSNKRGGKSNKKRSRKHKLRRRKTIHKKK
jgi:hypothetical protein